MTAPTITEPQLALVRTAAQAALAVLPTSRELTIGERRLGLSLIHI